MILLNYAHPLTDAQRSELVALLGTSPAVRNIQTHVDRARPLADVARELADAAEVTSAEWQTLPLVLNPPPLAPIALALIAEIHGRCGYFPAIVNIRPVEGAVPPRYEIAEIVNLQGIRDVARGQR